MDWSLRQNPVDPIIHEKNLALVCADCWFKLRPNEYEPDTYNMGECVMCHDQAFVHRVSWKEVNDEV